jgi:hypothetical protein
VSCPEFRSPTHALQHTEQQQQQQNNVEEEEECVITLEKWPSKTCEIKIKIKKM